MHGFYGGYTKQEFYRHVIEEWDNPANETHADVVNSLLEGRYSWQNVKKHYLSRIPSSSCWTLAFSEYCEDWHDGPGCAWNLLSDSERKEWISSDAYASLCVTTARRLVSAMQNKVTGAVTAMRRHGVILPRKKRKNDTIDYRSLRDFSQKSA